MEETMASQDINPLAPTGPGTNVGSGKAAIKDKVADMASQAKNTAADWGRSAATTVDRNLQSAAGALESTASALRERVPQTGKVNELATATADKIENTARYLRDHDTSDMVAGVESLVRRNPGASLAAALAVGFLIGTAMRKDREY
jgi:ElaB/YqjD/DUF883 family membrane-anchored ribosome-binding protein